MERNRIVKMNPAKHVVITPEFRVSFPVLFKAKSFQDQPNQPKNFSLDMLFESSDSFRIPYKGVKTQTPSMKMAILNAKVDQWGEDKARWPKMEHGVFKDGNQRHNRDGEVLNGYVDQWFLTAKSGEKFPPQIVNLSGQPLEETALYAGCYAKAQLAARPYMFGKNAGVRFLLLSVMKTREGERFGGSLGGAPQFDFREDSDGGFGAQDADDDDQKAVL